MRLFLIRFVCLAIILLMQTGCWDNLELNEIGLVTGIAIDKGKQHMYQFTVELSSPSEFSVKKTSGNSPSILYSLEGDSIAELSNKMNVGLSRRLVYTHTRIIVIGEALAREGTLEFLKYLQASREIRDTAKVFLAKGAQARDILGIAFPIDTVASKKLSSQLESGQSDWGMYPDVMLKTVIADMISNGRQPVMAAVTVRGPIEEGGTMEADRKIKPPAILEIIGMGIFKKEKLLGFVPLTDIRSYLWTQDQLKTTNITQSCGNKKKFIVTVYHSHTGIKARYVNEKPHIKVRLRMEGRIESYQCKEDTTKIATYQALEKKTNDYINKMVEGTIHKVQKSYGVDIFGFGEEMERQHFDQFKKVRDDWDEEFTRADIQVDVEVKIRHGGLITNSFFDETK
ncbi:Ger(x)C family spore germination protein [Paenibacillus sp. LPE1-1-1.1]|uniref:Ger(x)C family spore germination protein n=1 Tax=Paenibacillus sp. LPE1-1-1.1 TaxID=3135230 RepID=UPI0034459CEF